jgi:hypothetical protein
VALGVSVKAGPVLFHWDPETTSVGDAVQSSMDASFKKTGKKPQIIICIKETSDKDEYAEIKQASDCNLGVPSQCVLLKHCYDPKPRYLGKPYRAPYHPPYPTHLSHPRTHPSSHPLSLPPTPYALPTLGTARHGTSVLYALHATTLPTGNVCLKINQKLGGKSTAVGKNLAAKVDAGSTMLIGADVTHFTKENGKPSIAAMVGSLDPKFVSYASSLKFQSHTTETMEFCAEMFTELLVAYQKKNQKLPQIIIFYRDGVANSQFGMTLGVELARMKSAAAKFGANYQPKITYIILQKRHNVRLFPTTEKDMDRSGNLKSGLVIDSGITHPTVNDFYLVSQCGLKGTSKPSRYIILRDENKFTADEIQTFTYHQCFTFGRYNVRSCFACRAVFAMPFVACLTPSSCLLSFGLCFAGPQAPSPACLLSTIRTYWPFAEDICY